MSYKWLYRLVRIVVPLLLLAIILWRVDFVEVGSVLGATDPFYFTAGLILGFIFQVLIGSWRWQYYLRKAYGISLSYRWCINHYWVGMFLGYFVPGGIGWDAYRIVAGNKMSSGPLKHATIVLLEKIIGLIACAILIMASYPAVVPLFVSAKTLEVARWCFYVSLIGLAAAIVGGLLFRRSAVLLLRWFEKYLYRLAAPLFGGNILEHDTDILVRGFSALFRPSSFIALWGSSLIMKLFMALGGWCFLKAIHAELPFSINMFVLPLTTIIFMLPISFGSIGVREGSFILLYGLFGVLPAIALSASILGLIALILTVGIGGIIMLASGLGLRSARSVV